MTHPEDSLAERAAAWVPPWQRDPAPALAEVPVPAEASAPDAELAPIDGLAPVDGLALPDEPASVEEPVSGGGLASATDASAEEASPDATRQELVLSEPVEEPVGDEDQPGPAASVEPEAWTEAEAASTAAETIQIAPAGESAEAEGVQDGPSADEPVLAATVSADVVEDGAEPAEGSEFPAAPDLGIEEIPESDPAEAGWDCMAPEPADSDTVPPSPTATAGPETGTPEFETGRETTADPEAADSEAVEPDAVELDAVELDAVEAETAEPEPSGQGDPEPLTLEIADEPSDESSVDDATATADDATVTFEGSRQSEEPGHEEELRQVDGDQGEIEPAEGVSGTADDVTIDLEVPAAEVEPTAMTPTLEELPRGGLAEESAALDEAPSATNEASADAGALSEAGLDEAPLEVDDASAGADASAEAGASAVGEPQEAAPARAVGESKPWTLGTTFEELRRGEQSQDTAAPPAAVHSGTARNEIVPAPEPVAVPVPVGQPVAKAKAKVAAAPVTEEPAQLAAMDPAELRSALEAILLVVDEPVGETMLAQVLEQPTDRVFDALIRLAESYTEQGRGFELRRAAGGWRLYTREAYASYVERFILDGQSVRLTQAALETLSVVAYKQPVTRSRMSAIRGVNCDGVVRTLVSRGLIEECGAEPDSGAHLYRTTGLFLEKLGLDSLDQLPPLAPFLPDNVEELSDAST